MRLALLVFGGIVVLQAISLAVLIPIADPAWLGLAKNGVILGSLFMVLRLGGYSVRGVLRLHQLPILDLLLVTGMVVALMPMDSYVGSLFESGIAHDGRAALGVRSQGRITWISVVLLTPIAEEALFRGFLLRALGARSAWFGIVGSTGLFGLYHFAGYPGPVLLALPFGLALAYAVLATKTVLPAILGHSAWNALAVCSATGVLALPRSLAVACGSGVVAAGFALVLARRTRRRRARAAAGCGA